MYNSKIEAQVTLYCVFTWHDRDDNVKVPAITAVTSTHPILT